MVLEYIFTTMVRCTRVTGLITFKMEQELNLGLMAASMKGSISKVKNMAKACIYGLIRVTLKEIGTKIK